MEKLIKEALKTSTLKSTGEAGGGCICEGEAYLTDRGRVFIKRNAKAEAKLMFDGEFQSLMAIRETQTVTAPKPIMVLNNPSGGALLIMEYVEMKPLNKHSAKLGEMLARMHLHNRQLEQKLGSDSQYQSRFGFHCSTCCGYLAQNNTWCDDWVEFYTRQKLQPQVERIQQKYGDKEVGELFSKLKPVIPQFFKGLKIEPSLLHGDLWGGNAAENDDGPVVFDAACFYGHDEYDLAIAKMFGGFSSAFFKAYHTVIPKASGFEERHQLYKLFHYLNHWNHFGGGYRGSSLSTMKALINMKP